MAVLRAILVKALLILFLFNITCWAETKLRVSDVNWVISSKDSNNKDYIFDYNRLRLEADLYYGRTDTVFKLDNENYYGSDYINSETFQSSLHKKSKNIFDTDSEMQSSSENYNQMNIYRAYTGFESEKGKFTAGLFRVSQGVGRVWNPTDIYNPVNPLSIEKDERDGITGGSYEFFPSDFGRGRVVLSVNNDDQLDVKGFRYKNLLGTVDAGFSAVETKKFNMTGYEIEGNFGETGVELRSEGAWFNDYEGDVRYFKGIAGFDCGFENSLTLTVEYLYNGAGNKNKEGYYKRQITELSEWNEQGRDYLAVVINYELTPLIKISNSLILNMNDQSRHIAPSVSYSVSDESEIGLGMQHVSGGSKSEFYGYNDQYFTYFRIYF